MSGTAKRYRWAEQRLDHLRGGITRRFVASERVMLGEVRLAKGDRVPPHRHPQEQFTHVVSGALRFRLGANGEDVVEVGAGEVIVVPPDLLHEVEALEDTLEYDVFDSPRPDWLDPGTAFLRG